LTSKWKKSPEKKAAISGKGMFVMKPEFEELLDDFKNRCTGAAESTGHTYPNLVQNGKPELPEIAGTAIEADNTLNFVSIASLWEMAIKASLGKLELKTLFNQIGSQIEENGFEVLRVTFEDTFTVSTLPFHYIRYAPNHNYRSLLRRRRPEHGRSSSTAT
jgi:hypothetical protein